MSARFLVAGVGNVFFGDDGFGPEVARRLSEAPALGALRALDGSLGASGGGDSIEVVDFGIRGLHLAFRLLEPPELLIVLDALPRGGEPGSLTLLDPDLAEAPPGMPDAHGMELPAVFAAVRSMGGRLPRVLIIGCEPAAAVEGLGLSPPVAAAVEPAMEMVLALLGRERRAAGAAGGT